MRHLLIEISTALTAIFSFSLGMFSLARKYRSKVIILWFLTTMAVTTWSVGYLLTLNSSNDAIASLCIKIVYLGAVLIPILFFHFITTFLFIDRKYKPVIVIGYILSIIFLLLIGFTNFIISGVVYMQNFGRYEEVEPFGFKVFLVYFLFFTFFGFYFLLRSYKLNGGVRRRQIFYVILASIFGFVGGISNFVTDLTGVYPYGQMIVWLYPVFITYGIFMDEIQIKIKF